MDCSDETLAYPIKPSLSALLGQSLPLGSVLRTLFINERTEGIWSTQDHVCAFFFVEAFAAPIACGIVMSA